MRVTLGLTVCLVLCNCCQGQTLDALRQQCTVLEGHRYDEIAAAAKTQNGALSELASPRDWKDKSGSFSVQAKCVAYKEDDAGDLWVQLEKQDGTRVAIKENRLDASDRKLLRGLTNAAQLVAFVLAAENASPAAVNTSRAAIIAKYERDRSAIERLEKRGDAWLDQAAANAQWLLVRMVDVPDEWLRTPLVVPSATGANVPLAYPHKYEGPGGSLDVLGAVPGLDRVDYGVDLAIARSAARFVINKGLLPSAIGKNDPVKEGKGADIVDQRYLYALNISAYLPIHEGLTGLEVAEKIKKTLSPPEFTEAATVAWFPRALDRYERAASYRIAFNKIYLRTAKPEGFRFLEENDGKGPVQEIYEWYVFLSRRRPREPADSAAPKAIIP